MGPEAYTVGIREALKRDNKQCVYVSSQGHGEGCANRTLKRQPLLSETDLLEPRCLTLTLACPDCPSVPSAPASAGARRASLHPEGRPDLAHRDPEGARPLLRRHHVHHLGIPCIQHSIPLQPATSLWGEQPLPICHP